MRTLRTPDHRFADPPGYPFEPHDVDVDDRQPHVAVERAHHFLQEDAAPQSTQIVLDSIRSA